MRTQTKNSTDLMASKGIGRKVCDEFHYDEEEVVCNCGLRAIRKISRTSTNPNRKFFGFPRFKDNRACDFFEWYDVRIAVFKATRVFSEMVAKLELENKELRASLDRVMKEKHDARPTNENERPGCRTDLVEEIQFIKQSLEHLELEATSRK